MERMERLTAIEWLVEELTRQNMFMHLFAKEIEQAKEMEKKQKIEDKLEILNLLQKNLDGNNTEENNRFAATIAVALVVGEVVWLLLVGAVSFSCLALDLKTKIKIWKHYT